MFLDMLERAVEALKDGREPQLDKPLAARTEVELHVPAFLPDDYVADVHVRLALYKRIAAADAAGLEELTAELVDRFGELPAAAGNLLKVARLKLRARELGVRRLDLAAGGGHVLFEEKNALDPAVVIRLIQKFPKELRLEGSLKLRVTSQLGEVAKRFDYAQDLLQRFSGRSA
jgi:transcription-repair coupling factor (superfamily II helicase)